MAKKKKHHPGDRYARPGIVVTFTVFDVDESVQEEALPVPEESPKQMDPQQGVLALSC